MSADLGAFFHNHHVDFIAFFSLKLLQANGGGKACGPRPDDHDVEFHGLAFEACIIHPASLSVLMAVVLGGFGKNHHKKP